MVGDEGEGSSLSDGGESFSDEEGEGSSLGVAGSLVVSPEDEDEDGALSPPDGLWLLLLLDGASDPDPELLSVEELLVGEGASACEFVEASSESALGLAPDAR